MDCLTIHLDNVLLNTNFTPVAHTSSVCTSTPTSFSTVFSSFLYVDYEKVTAIIRRDGEKLVFGGF